MPWRETCRMDERMRFVLCCAAGEESFLQLCRGYGVSRRTGYKWLDRYRAFGPVGLVDRSRAPHSHRHGTAKSLPAYASCSAEPASVQKRNIEVGSGDGRWLGTRFNTRRG